MMLELCINSLVYKEALEKIGVEGEEALTHAKHNDAVYRTLERMCINTDSVEEISKNVSRYQVANYEKMENINRRLRCIEIGVGILLICNAILWYLR